MGSFQVHESYGELQYQNDFVEGHGAVAWLEVSMDRY
jgi:hypothetical protein